MTLCISKTLCKAVSQTGLCLFCTTRRAKSSKMIWGGTKPLCRKITFTVKLLPLAEWRRARMFCIFHSKNMNTCIYPKMTKQLLGSEHKGQKLWETEHWKSSHPCSRQHSWPSAGTDFESTGNWIFSVCPLPLDHSLLFTSWLPLSATRQFTTSFHLSGAPKGLGAIAKQIK